jgi:hypothetical protein
MVVVAEVVVFMVVMMVVEIVIRQETDLIIP